MVVTMLAVLVSVAVMVPSLTRAQLELDGIEVLTTSGDIQSPCSLPCVDGDLGDNDPDTIDIGVGYVGDIAWCNDQGDGWDTTIEDDVFPDTEETFENINTPTDVNLYLAWMSCTTTPGTYDHSEGNYAHEDEGDDTVYTYPFNKVPDNHFVSECQGQKDSSGDGDTSYLNAEQGLFHEHDDGSKHWHPHNPHNGFVGIFAARYHAEAVHGAPTAQIVQLLHRVYFDDEDNNDDPSLWGRACLPGEGSVAREPIPASPDHPTRTTPAHEVGHNFEALHSNCELKDPIFDEYSIMSRFDTDRCPVEDNYSGWERVLEFSGENRDSVNDHASATYG